MESVGSCQSYDTSSSSSSEESKLPESDVSCISSDVEGTFADDPDCIKSGSPDPSCLPKCSTSRQRERRLRRDVVRKRGGSKTVRFDIDMNHRRANRMVEAIPESSATPAESQSGDRPPDEHNFRQAEKLAGKSSSHLFARCVRIPGNQPQHSDGTIIDNSDSAPSKPMATKDRQAPGPQRLPSDSTPGKSMATKDRQAPDIGRKWPLQ